MDSTNPGLFETDILDNVTGSSVVEQCDRHPETAGSIPTQFQIFVIFEIFRATELTMILIVNMEILEKQ